MVLCADHHAVEVSPLPGNLAVNAHSTSHQVAAEQ